MRICEPKQDRLHRCFHFSIRVMNHARRFNTTNGGIDPVCAYNAAMRTTIIPPASKISLNRSFVESEGCKESPPLYRACHVLEGTHSNAPRDSPSAAAGVARASSLQFRRAANLVEFVEGAHMPFEDQELGFMTKMRPVAAKTRRPIMLRCVRPRCRFLPTVEVVPRKAPRRRQRALQEWSTVVRVGLPTSEKKDLPCSSLGCTYERCSSRRLRNDA